MELNIPIIDYYKKVVVPVNPKRYWVKNDKMMVCPLHDDVNPSMGIIKGKDGKETFHCFGCNAWGTVVDLHRRVSKRLYNKYLSETDALKDLCRLFDLDYEEESSIEDTSTFDEDMRVDYDMRKAMESFDISDFRNMLRQGKVERKGVAYFNTLVMIMINQLKEEG